MMQLQYNGNLEKTIITKQFTQNLSTMMGKDTNIVYLDADLMFAWGMGDLLKKYPERMIKCGIAEANMVGVAAGMSLIGFKPIIHSFASFITRRVFDQIFLSVAYPDKSMNIIGSEPGYTQTFNGGTHMAFEDIAMMRTIPNCHIFDIVDGVQFNKLITQTKDLKGIYYYRVPLKDNIAVYNENTTFKIGKGITLKNGVDATIIASGRLVTLSLEAAKLLEKENISIKVIDMFTIKPLDTELILQSAKDTGAIITAENHSIYGGLGSSVAEFLSENYPVPMELIGIRDKFGEVGSEEYLRKKYHINPQDIADKVKQTIKRKST